MRKKNVTRNDRNNMKKIDIDDELYQYIASNTQSIGESASTILRRLLNIHDENDLVVPEKPVLADSPSRMRLQRRLKQLKTPHRPRIKSQPLSHH